MVIGGSRRADSTASEAEAQPNVKERDPIDQVLFVLNNHHDVGGSVGLLRQLWRPRYSTCPS